MTPSVRRSRNTGTRLRLHALEDRLAPATATWINPAGGAWATGSNWDVGHAPTGSDEAVIAPLNSGATVTLSSGTSAIQGLTLGGSLTLAGGNLTITGGGTVGGTLTVKSASNFNVQAGATVAVQPGASVIGFETSGTTFGIVVNGTLTASGASFTRAGSNYGSSTLQVNGGGKLTATNSTFAWAGLTLASGNLLGAGDLTNNTFDGTLTLPASGVQHLGGNRSFRDISILAGTLSAGTLALNAIGDATTANLRYLFPGNFLVAAGATLTVAPNVAVQIEPSVTLTASGALTFGAGSSVVAREGAYPSFGIVVNGTMTATGASFTRGGANYGSSALLVNGGGKLTATNSTFAWAALTLASGNLLGAGDLTNNTFDTPFTLPFGQVQYLGANRSFRDIYIPGATIPAGQTLALNAIGTATTANLRYLFPGNFLVAAGATLTVAPNVAVQIEPSVTLTASGALTFGAGSSVVAREGAYPSFGIVVNGTMTATGASFTRGGANYGSSALTVNGGGKLTATNSTFGWAALTLASGNLLGAGDLTNNTFDSPLTLPASGVRYLSGSGNDNRSFGDIYLLAGTWPGGTLALNAIGTATTANLRYLFPGNFLVAAGATLTVAPNVAVQIEPSATLTANGSLTFGTGSSVVAREGAYPSFGIVVNGTMTATGASFTRGGANYGSSALLVNGGGKLTATNSTFAWAALTLASGNLFGAGDLTNNTFESPLTLPYHQVQYLADNRSFRDIYILAGTVPAGQTLALNAIGTATTANLRYLFPGNFLVAAGAAMTVAPNVAVQIEPGATLTAGGAITIASGASVVAREGAYPTFGIVVNGTLTTTDATFTRGGANYGSSALIVNGGGRLIARDNTFAWAALTLAPGSVLNAGDVTANGFDQPINIPAMYAALLADNRRFKDVVILPGGLGAGQTATLALMGTDTTVDQKYVFNAAAGNFSVPAGATLNVTGGATVVALETAYTPFGIAVGGTMNVTDATFVRAGANYASSTLAVNAGGRLTATDASFAWANVALNFGSTADFQFLSFANKLTINGGATIDITANNFSALGANGVVAVGDPNAVIDLRANFWGTTVAAEIAAKVQDHADDVTRPTVLYTPYLNNPSTAVFDPAALPPARAGAAYTLALSAVPGTGPASNFRVTRGALPAGLALSADGVLSGTPTAAGSFTLTVTADETDAVTGPYTASQLYWLTVSAPVITFTPATLPAARAGAGYSQTLTATGGTGPYSQFAVSAGALPAGLALAADGSLSGTPTAADGTFNFTVTARDATTGPAAPYTGSQSYNLVVDNTAPTTGAVNDGPGADIDFQASPTAVAANWSGFADPDSGIAGYQWAVGTAAGATDVRPFTDVGNVLTAAASGLTLIDGAAYYVSVRAIDRAGNVSAPAGSDGVTVDATPPTPGTVNDGAGADIDFQASATTIAANWAGFGDAGSGLAGYQWAVGTTPGGADVRAFTAVGTATGATASGLGLSRGTTYYVSVRAADAVGNVGAAATSDGVTVAPPAPVFTGFSTDSGVVGDGLTNDKTPTLFGTAEAGSVVQLYDTGSPVGTTTAAANGAWQFTTAALPDGPHGFTGTATDTTGHTSLLSDPFAISIDTAAPTVTINQAAGQPDPTNAAQVTFSVHFSEPVTGFTASDVDLSAGSVGGTAQVSGSGADYTVTVTGMSGAGSVVASVPAGAAADAAGTANPASTSTDNAIAFDNVRPTATIDRAAGQPDPTSATPVLFAVHFSEPVTGFTAADVSLSGGTVGGTLAAAVSGSGADYTVAVSGMFGAGTVVASVPAGAAADAAGNTNTASTSTDNAVYFNHVGVLQFTAPVFDTAEGAGTATITVSRVNGGDGPTSVTYTTADGTAQSPADYGATAGTLAWADGDSAPKTITVPIVEDALNEGAERFALTLAAPTGNAELGSRTTTTVAVAKSDGVAIRGTDRKPQSTFADLDQDAVTLKLGGKVGSLTYYLTNGAGPISEIDLAGTDSAKSTVGLSIKKVGDGRVGVGGIAGTGAKSLSLAKADLVGPGIDLTSFLGALTIGAVANGADITLAGAPPATGARGTKLTAGVIGDGTAIAITGAPLGSLTAITIGDGTISAPSVGTITVKGKAKTKTTAAIPGDFKSDLTVAGTGLAALVPALKTLKVAGGVSGSTILVGTGDVGSVTAGTFTGSRLFAGYTGADDGSGAFGGSSVVRSFKVTGRTAGFADSHLVAQSFKTMTLASIDPTIDGTLYGVAADDSVGTITITLPVKVKFTGAGTQGDFRVRIV